MPELEDVFETDDGYVGSDSEAEVHRLNSSRDANARNGSSNRLAVRHAIEARREQRRIARDLDSIEFELDNF